MARRSQKSRPMVGSNFKAFIDKHKLNTLEACHVFGIVSVSKLYERMKQEEPLSPAIAILLRFYTKYPEEMPLLKNVDAAKLRDKVNNVFFSEDPVSMTDFSLMLGSKVSAVSRWKYLDIQPLMFIQRLLQVVDKLSNQEDFERFNAYLAMVEEEASARGVDLYSDKDWDNKLTLNTDDS